MKDIQNNKDNRNIEIKEVGIKNIILPLYILDKAKKRQMVVAKVKMSVDLAKNCRGTHMSRFIEIIEHYRGYDFNSHSVPQILNELKKRLNAKSALVEVSFDYFIEKKSPISKKKGLVNYQCKIIGKIIKNRKVETSLNVLVPISCVCPCSMAISDYGAHNQRGIVSLKVKTNKLVWIEDLILLVEKYGGSSDVYSLLKREDEKHITEKMFKNPKFVEDVVRDIATNLKDDSRIDKYSIECINFESIHNHNAYAKITN
ncbi:MAG: GTP cyclohydrolase FolE2 [bacterium]|nr:GTP cyclohydrolase FolE2 [bacterium]